MLEGTLINQLYTFCALFLEKYGKPNKISTSRIIAERMGFEPTIQLPIYKLSRLAPSTTRTPL